MQGSDKDIIQVSEVHYISSTIYAILEKVVSKLVVNMIHNLTFLFNYASLQSHDVEIYSSPSHH